MFYRSLTLILVALLICGLFFVRVNADDPSVNYHKPDLNYAAILLNNKEIALLDQWRSLDKLEIQQAMLRVRWDDNTEDMVENAISLGNAVTVDVLQIVASLISTTANSIITRITSRWRLPARRKTLRFHLKIYPRRSQ